MPKADILVVIPAYNEEANIVAVVQNLIENYPQYDYVVVNDGSRDHTAELCREHHYNLLDLPVNLGLSGAFQTGLRYAYRMGYARAIQLDADGQHLPQYIEPISQEMDKGADIVIGSRFITKKKPINLRMFGSFIISFAIRFTTHRALTDPTSGMRMLNREMIAEFSHNLNYAPEPDTISYLISRGAKVAEVQVEMGERTAGKSYLNMRAALRYMAQMCTSIFLIQWVRKRETEEVQPYV